MLARDDDPSGSSIVLDELAGMPGERVIESFDEDVLADEVVGPFGPGREDFFLLHLIEGFVGVQGFLNHGRRFLEHFDVLADVVEIGNDTVAGDDSYVGRKLPDGFFYAVNHALHAAAAGDINEGKTVTDEIVTHVNDIVFGKEDDGVSVSVAGGKMQGADIFPVEMDGDVMLEGDDGKSSFFRGLDLHFHGTAVAGNASGSEAFADIVLRDEGRARRCERSISARVVAVVMSIDDKTDGLVRNAE